MDTIALDPRGNRISPSQKPSLTEASRRGLSDLPQEIQLQILEDCLITRPYIKLVVRDDLGVSCCLPWQYLDVSLSILLTCQLYWTEGSRIFWERNRFLFCASLSKMGMCDLNAYRILLPKIQHVVLDYPIPCCCGSYNFSLADVGNILQHMPSLKSLEVQLMIRENCLCPDDPYCYYNIWQAEAYRINLASKQAGLKSCEGRIQRLIMMAFKNDVRVQYAILEGESLNNPFGEFAGFLRASLRAGTDKAQ